MNPSIRRILALAFSLLTGVVLLINSVSVNAAGGDLDPSFNPGTGSDVAIQAMALQPDGKIIVGGFFTS
jgi:hypothetical protein